MNRKLSPFWTLFILTGLNLFNYLDRYVMAAVLGPVKNHFNLSDGEAGRTTTTFMLGYFVTAPLFGFLGDRISRKWLVAAGIAIWSIGTLLTGMASTFFLFLSFRVLVGVGEASYATISPGVISDAFPAGKRNNALTIFYVAIPVGAALGYLLGGQVEARWGWRHAFIWAGVPGLVFALALLPFREQPRGQVDGISAAKPGLRDVLNLFRIPDYMLVVLGYTAYTFALGAFANWGPTFLSRVHGVDNAKATLFFSGVTAGAGLLGTFVGGFAATAWRRRNPAAYSLMLGFSTATAVPLAVAAFMTRDTTASMACLASAIFLLFLSTGPINTLIIESVPVNLRASGMAISIFMIHLFGDLWSTEIVGRLSDHWQSLRSAALILPGALAVAAVFWLGLAVKTRRACKTGAVPG
ncbi:MAG: transporter, Spinster family, sphingosine-phosphate transporter [Verrucomicrobiota bacterium]|jgi:MFS family permease